MEQGDEGRKKMGRRWTGRRREQGGWKEGGIGGGGGRGLWMRGGREPDKGYQGKRGMRQGGGEDLECNHSFMNRRKNGIERSYVVLQYLLYYFSC